MERRMLTVTAMGTTMSWVLASIDGGGTVSYPSEDAARLVPSRFFCNLPS